MRASITCIRTIARARIISLMILVAFSAVTIWTAKTGIEIYRYRPIRVHRLQMADVHRRFLQAEEKSARASPNPMLNQWVADQIRYRKDLEQKYRKGAAEPWVDLPPDPPDPPFPMDKLAQEVNAIKMQSAKALREADRLLKEGIKPESPAEAKASKKRLAVLKRMLEKKKRVLEAMRSAYKS